MGLLNRGHGSAGWPVITNNYGLSVHGTIKRASVTDVLRLGEEAARRRWSAKGRPAWLTENSERVADIYVTFLLPEHGRIRCAIIVTFKGTERGGTFTLDMAQAEFDSLKDVRQEELVTFAHRYFKSFPTVPLDPDQQASWDQWLGREAGKKGGGPHEGSTGGHSVG